MYAAVINDQLIGIHDKLKPVKLFCKLQNKCVKIIKIKNKACSKIFNKEDLYLENYRGIYIPREFLNDVSKFIEGNNYNLINAVCALEDIMNTNLSKNDKKAIKRTSELLIKECYNIYELSDIKFLKAIKDLQGGF